MSMMSDLFASGTFVDLVLLFLLVEAVAVIGWWHWKRRGVAPADFLPGMISGALMLLALRAVIAGLGWMVPTACLLLAGLAHLIDVVRRWRS
jgi:hypothetical protein